MPITTIQTDAAPKFFGFRRWIAIIATTLVIHALILVAILNHQPVEVEPRALREVEVEPRALREVNEFHQRVHGGLTHLHQLWKANNSSTHHGISPKLEFAAPAAGTLPVSLRQWIWKFPSDVLPASDLTAFGNLVRDGWEIPRMYPDSGGGAGGSSYSMSYGDAHMHTSIFMTAFEANGTTTIHSQSIVIDADFADESWSARPAATQASLDRFRRQFLDALQDRCNPHVTTVDVPRPHTRYQLTDRYGSGNTNPIRNALEWNWTVPEAALAPGALRAFASAIAADWDAHVKIPPGEAYAVTIPFGNGAHQACIDIIATPKKAKADGTPETLVRFQSLLFLGKPRSPLAPPPVKPLDLAALESLPGSTERELIENSNLDADGRMLKSLRGRAEKSRMSWQLEYNLRFSEAPPEEELDAFATKQGMTWTLKSLPSPRDGAVTHYLRFFKVLEFSESEIKATTAAVRQFSDQHAGSYTGWNYKSHRPTPSPALDGK